MRTKIFGILCGLLFTAASASAYTESVVEDGFGQPYANVGRGGLLIGLATGAGWNSDAGRVSSISPQIEYFFIDQLSVGLSGRMQMQPNVKPNYFFGPSLTFYFWGMEKWSASAGAKYYLSRTGDSLVLSTGLNYHLSENFAIGPRVNWESDFTSVSFTGDLAISLLI